MGSLIDVLPITPAYSKTVYKMKKRFLINFLMIFLSIIIFFACSEIAIRGLLFFKNRKSFKDITSEPPVVESEAGVDMGEIIKPSDYNDIIYELKPNLDVIFMGTKLKTNEQGWRHGPCQIAKDKDTIRIIGLGDSHMFGWGVSQNKKYTDVLEARLNSEFKQKNWEVINTAVPGYNIYMEAETLRKKALAYHPDIVLIEYIGNDLDLPSFIIEETDFLNLRKSFLLNFLLNRIDILKTKFCFKMAPLVFDKKLGSHRNAGEQHLDKVPQKYRHMVGWPGFIKAMRTLKNMQKNSGFDVIICVSHNWPEGACLKITRLCQELGFYVLVNFQPIEPSLVLSSEDSHPSELGHKFIADSLFNFMVDCKIICERISQTG
jgi:hypothetical protein